jgi:hypothetical protein
MKKHICRALGGQLSVDFFSDHELTRILHRSFDGASSRSQVRNDCIECVLYVTQWNVLSINGMCSVERVH